MKLISAFFLICTVAAPAAVTGPPLLGRAVEKWLAEANHWAFTVRVKEFDGDAVKEERVEHYDPSRPAAARWQLEAVNGRAPTDERRAAWQRYKARRRRNAPKSLSEYMDFENARIATTTPTTVSYRLPLRGTYNWLFPVDHIALTVTVNKTSHAIEQVEAGIAEPFRVALGLAQVLDVDFDMRFYPTDGQGPAVGPAAAHPEGQAHVVVNRLGERIEYTWCEFRRVTPHPENVTIATTRRWL